MEAPVGPVVVAASATAEATPVESFQPRESTPARGELQLAGTRRGLPAS